MEPNPIHGYWIVGAMSPFLLHGIGGLAGARVRAERAVEAADPGAMASLREVLAKQWGVPFVPPKSARQTDAASVAERAEPALKLGAVPAGVRFLVTSIDVQANRFELLTRGFGPGLESWIIDHRRIAADPASDPADWDETIKAALEAEYPLADGSGRRMKVRAVGYDSGGKAGVTEQAYAVWKRARNRTTEIWRGSNLVRFHGQVSNRDAWSLLPLKGASSPRASRLVITYPDGGRKDRHVSARGEVPLGIFNTDMFKDSLQAQLARAESGPPAVHIPAQLRGNWPHENHKPDAPHLWLNQLFAETRRATGAWVKTIASAPNEATDLMVMTHVLAHLHASRIDWQRPPAWAAEWPSNSNITGAGTAPPAQPSRPTVGLRQPRTPTDHLAPMPPATATVPGPVPPPAIAARDSGGAGSAFRNLARLLA